MKLKDKLIKLEKEITPIVRARYEKTKRLLPSMLFGLALIFPALLYFHDSLFFQIAEFLMRTDKIDITLIVAAPFFILSAFGLFASRWTPNAKKLFMQFNNCSSLLINGVGTSFLVMACTFYLVGIYASTLPEEWAMKLFIPLLTTVAAAVAFLLCMLFRSITDTFDEFYK